MALPNPDSNLPTYTLPPSPSDYPVPVPLPLPNPTSFTTVYTPLSTPAPTNNPLSIPPAAMGDINQICSTMNNATGYLASPEQMEGTIIALSIICGLLVICILLLLTAQPGLFTRWRNSKKQEKEKSKKGGSVNSNQTLVNAFLKAGPPVVESYGVEGSSGGRGRRRRERERDPFAGFGPGLGMPPPMSYHPGMRGSSFQGGSERDGTSADLDGRGIARGGPRRQKRSSRYEGSDQGRD